MSKPKHLIEDIVQKLSLKQKLCEIYEPAKTPQIKKYEHALVENFDENILLLTNSDLIKTKYPNLLNFMIHNVFLELIFFIYLNV